MGPFSLQEYVEGNENLYKNEEEKVISCKVRISFTYSGIKATNLQALLYLPRNLICPKNPINIEEIKGNATPFSIEMNVYVSNTVIPYSREG